jgi:hypothetical protein
MDLNALQKRLLLAARKNPPSEAVPLAFEQRIMARLAARATADIWAQWSRGLWRAAFSCALVSLAVGGWSVSRMSHDPGPEAMSIAFEKTVFASMDQAIEDSW